MTEVSLSPVAAERRAQRTTPAGIQTARTLFWRRTFYAAACAVTYAGLAWAIVRALGLLNGPPQASKAGLLVLALMAMPWYVIGLWNALIGFWLLRRKNGGIDAAVPFVRAANGWSPVRTRTAIVMTVRNEDPRRAFDRLGAVVGSLEATADGKQFDYFVLSDTSDPKIAELEETLCRAWPQSLRSGARLTYRRRDANIGFKAGNIQDFIRRWGKHYDFMLPLDADSTMSAEAVLTLVRIMQAYPRIGILQSLAVGAPARSPFARLFQFGMRHGMRSYTMGSAWWTADCGPYWGHNALVRVEPFGAHCKLAPLPGKPPLGGAVLSHDQLEAALMRRAGYEVRVVPIEGGSYEDNPPGLLEFLKRDIRWCQGNLQYVRCLAWRGLKTVSRVQIALAILMYLGSAAATAGIGAALALGASGAMTGGISMTAPAALALLFLLSNAPKLLGVAETILRKRGASEYGGIPRLLSGVGAELIFSWFLSAIVTVRSTVFMLGLAAGTSVTWGGQVRDAHGVSWKEAAAALWPETVGGMAFLSVLAGTPAMAFGVPLLAPLCLSIPFAVMTSSPRLGTWLKRAKLCGIPEEFTVPPDRG